MLGLHIRVVYQDAEGMDVHWYCGVEGQPTKVGALYWLDPKMTPMELLAVVIHQLKGLDASGVGGEEENPDIREAEKASTSNHSPSSASSAGA